MCRSKRRAEGFPPAAGYEVAPSALRRVAETTRKLHMGWGHPNFLSVWALFGLSAWWSMDHPDHHVPPPLQWSSNIMPAAKGLRSGVGFWLLAADRGGWRCLAIASAVWDNVGGRRSQQRHRGKPRSAADCGGLLCIARRLRYGTSSKDGADDNLGC
jgi:hypothetical protein